MGVCGCGGGPTGPALAEVTGTVTFNGKALAGASVTMTNVKGEMSDGMTDASGKFKLTTGGRPGVPLGPMKVGITKSAAANPGAEKKTMTPEDMRTMQMAGGGKAVDLTPKSEIPIRYADPNSSGLKATVDADSKKNVFEFPLVD